MMTEGSEKNSRQNRKKSSGKRNRRRYFRRNERNENERNENEPNKGRNSSPEKRKRSDENQRRARRNRRRRRSSDSSPEEKVAPVINAIESDYVPPASFFAYTHVVRSSDTRDGYEYRPERLSRGGRRLEDFRIDLSPLFAEKSAENAPTSTALDSGDADAEAEAEAEAEVDDDTEANQTADTN